MTKFDLTNIKKYIVITIFVVIIGILYRSIYDITSTKQETNNRNIQSQLAMPQVQLQNISNPNIATNNAKLTSCVLDSDCSSLGEEYVCTEVDEPNRYRLGDIKVQPGNWCLPKKNVGATCNQYTGEWVWSFSDTCPSGEQCWKCECKYPSLYSGESCSDQDVCINTNSVESPISGDEQLASNYLIGTPYSPFPGKKWDPNDPDPELMRYGPYDVDSQGRPLFYCSCGSGFTLLPDDPYICHVDTCLPAGQRVYTVFGCTDKYGNKCNYYENPTDCICKCQCDKHSSIPVKDGHCYPEVSLCKELNTVQYTQKGDSTIGSIGQYDSINKDCLCNVSSNGISVSYKSRKCYSNYVNQEFSDYLPACKNPDNPIGSECYDPCNPNPCSPGTCSLDNTKPDGYICDCSVINPIKYDLSNQPIEFDQFQDNTCSSGVCAKDAAHVQTQTFLGEVDSGKDLTKTIKCCSGQTYSSYDVANARYNIYCNPRDPVYKICTGSNKSLYNNVGGVKRRVLLQNQSMNQCDILYSPSDQYFMVLQSDGNLIIYDPSGNSTWSTGTGTFQDVATTAIFQSDGNFVLYDDKGKPKWASNTNGKGGILLSLDMDGKLVIYSDVEQTNIVWST